MASANGECQFVVDKSYLSSLDLSTLICSRIGLDQYFSSQIVYQSSKCFKLYNRVPKSEVEKNGEKREVQFVLAGPQTMGWTIRSMQSFICKFEFYASTDPLLVYHS